ncbi:MAG TPA: NAD-dependent epimerase/dehydratase family protein [Longimicrobiaceae bacterium]|nr:NAD-dependent epimerase/dehydratase family protein [Longimicrobiaceae bacterium]
MTAEAQERTGRSALVMGATGLVGGHCVDLLLNAAEYSKVRVLGRRPFGRPHPKLEDRVLDYDRFEEYSALFAVDDIFCCLGTTIRKAGSPEAFRKVDVEFPATAARLGAEMGADQFLVVSALGADPDSLIFYNKAKGEMEAEVRRAPLRAVWVVRPSLLLGDREELRIGERIAEVLLRPVAPLLLGPLRRLRPIEAATVAAAMVALALSGGTGGTLESEEIAAVAASGA